MSWSGPANQLAVPRAACRNVSELALGHELQGRRAPATLNARPPEPFPSPLVRRRSRRGGDGELGGLAGQLDVGRPGHQVGLPNAHRCAPRLPSGDTAGMRSHSGSSGSGGSRPAACDRLAAPTSQRMRLWMRMPVLALWLGSREAGYGVRIQTRSFSRSNVRTHERIVPSPRLPSKISRLVSTGVRIDAPAARRMSIRASGSLTGIARPTCGASGRSAGPWARCAQGAVSKKPRTSLASSARLLVRR